jgi:hypothetical protein
MVGVRTNRLELDELWAFVQRKRRQHQAPGMDSRVTGDQYTYVAMSPSSRAIISYLTGKRTSDFGSADGTHTGNDNPMNFDPVLRPASLNMVAQSRVSHLRIPLTHRRTSKPPPVRGP